MCILTSDGERRMVGKSSAVIERTLTETRDWSRYVPWDGTGAFSVSFFAM